MGTKWPYLLLSAFFLMAGCRHKSAPAAATPSADSEYLDLKGGDRVSVTVPSLRGGGYTAKLDSVKENGGTLTGSVADLVGFQVSRYEVEGKADGRVRLRFQSAETTRDGKKLAEKKAPELPFKMPRGYQYVRLIYFVRSSQADHNMAIAAAKGLLAMNDFTRRMHDDPAVCQTSGTVSCVWVPPGVAVRTE